MSDPKPEEPTPVEGQEAPTNPPVAEEVKGEPTPAAQEESKAVPTHLLKVTEYTEDEVKQRTAQVKGLHEHATINTSEIPVQGFGGRIRIQALFAQPEKYYDTKVKICGWGRTVREGGKGAFAFVEINDGTAFKGIQVSDLHVTITVCS